MSVTMLGVKYKGDKRDRYLHHGHPLLKLGLWLLFTALPFLFPNSMINAYSESSAVCCLNHCSGTAHARCLCVWA